MRNRFWLFACVPLLFAAATRADDKPAADTKLRVAVSIPPQAHFVERVGGEAVQVQVLVGAGASPHAYEPTARQVADIAQARAYFTIGVEFENALVRRLREMFPQMTIVDTRKGVTMRRFAEHERGCDHSEKPGDKRNDAHEDAHDHEHGEDCDHGDPYLGRDPHIWLSPRMAKIQAQTVCDALCELVPANAAAFRKNLAAFHEELDRVHDEIAATLAPLKGQEIIVFHAAFGYFTDEFGLRQVPVEIEGKEPTARQLAALIEFAKAHQAKVIFVQPQFSRKSAESLARAIGGVVVPIDPLARDYVSNLRQIAATIRAQRRGPEPAASSSNP